jgi:hypothetical protein
VGLHDECTAFCRQWEHVISGEVKMKSSHDISARAVLEHPEVRANTWIEIKKLILAISLVEAIIEIHYPGITYISQ